MKMRKLAYTSPREIIKKLRTAGSARKYIADWSTVKPGDKLVLVLRVSGYVQGKKGNLDNQEAKLRYEAALRGAIVIAVFRKVISGFDPLWLAYPAKFANENGAKLMAESTDRFVRHPHYHSKRDPSLQATDGELDELKRMTDDAVLVTFLDPEASPAVVRSYQRRRGQWAKNRKGGRPRGKRPGYKKEIRRRFLRQVMKMHHQGASLGDIHVQTNVPKTTIRRWILDWS